MRISADWLNSMAAAGWDAATLARRLTMAGLEVEALEPAAPAFRGVVVGEVLECERHPDADKLSVCRVAAGGEVLQVVCGAANVRKGLKVALAQVGATLPGGLGIRRAKLRGVESQGMLCSAQELGIGEGVAGILELPPEFEPGADLRVALGLDDAVLTINLTPNRGDCLSVLGVAREVAALSGCTLRAPECPVVGPVHEDRHAVRVEAPAACPKFVGRVLRGIDPAAVTPLWIQERLRRAGLRCISPVVDVTNYVMLEVGQPMHAYDLRRLSGDVVVRQATVQEPLTLLDGRELRLDPDVLVIADAAGPLGLAGIMGGEKSGIVADTRDVFLEVAWFAPSAIAGRARRYGLHTDASQRFERGVDPTLSERAMERATDLLVGIAGASPGPTVVTASGELAGREAPVVTMRKGHAASLLGIEIPEDEIPTLLRRLGMAVDEKDGSWLVTPPPFRFDIEIAQDLVEEVARLRGYDTIPIVDALSPERPGCATERSVVRERVAMRLADRGYQEAITYSFVDPALQRLLFPESQALSLANPIASDLSEMRVSLWPGLLRALRENLRRQQDRVRLFESGIRFDCSGNALVERQTVAGVCYGKSVPEQWDEDDRESDFYDLKGDVEAVLALAGAGGLRFVAGGPPCLHPGRSAWIERRGERIGVLGELHPQLAREFDLKAATLLFELDFDRSFSSQPAVYTEISRFPHVRRDLAVVVDERVVLDALVESASVAGAGLLREIRIFDVYRGAGIESGRKSVALGLIFQDSSRTLTDTDVDQVVALVAARLKQDHDATLRE